MTDVASLSSIIKRRSNFGCWESLELLLLLLFSTVLVAVLFLINSLSIFTNSVVGNWVDDDEDKFKDEDTGDVNCTVLLLFVVDLLLWMLGWFVLFLFPSSVDNNFSFVWIDFTVCSFWIRPIFWWGQYHGEILRYGEILSSGLSFLLLLTTLFVFDFICW